MLIPVDKILPNPEQPRVTFDPRKLQGLANSIARLGVIEPIVVEEAADGYYILHAGERRVRASRLVGLSEIPAQIVPPANGAGPKDRLLRALVENIQREDMNPVEEARAYQVLRDREGMSIAAIAATCGVSQGRVDARLALLELEPEIQELVAAGKLPRDQKVTRALLTIPEPEARLKLAAVLAKRNPGIQTCVRAAAKLTEQLAEQPCLEPDAPPALSIGISRARRVRGRSEWNALKQLGKLPPWTLVVEAASKVCASCAIRDIASPVNCKDCAGVEMIRLLVDSKEKMHG
jgi:ParB family chromosome partitioning protein